MVLDTKFPLRSVFVPCASPNSCAHGIRKSGRLQAVFKRYSFWFWLIRNLIEWNCVRVFDAFTRKINANQNKVAKLQTNSAPINKRLKRCFKVFFPHHCEWNHWILSWFVVLFEWNVRDYFRGHMQAMCVCVWVVYIFIEHFAKCKYFLK